MIVGLTGPMGAGKSTVASLFAQRGAAIVDTDVLARQVVEPPSPVLDSIVREFGANIIGFDGRLDRQKLAAIVFADENKRERLNELTHPAILKAVMADLAHYTPATVVIVVVPLLFESHFERNCRLVVAVVAPREIRRARIAQRDGLSAAAIDDRLHAQLPDAEYERRADIVIRNDGDRESLDRNVATAWTAITRSAAHETRRR